MSGFNLARKMKRTKQQELRVVESMNRQNIEKLMEQQMKLAQEFSNFVNELGGKYNAFVAQTILFQKEVLALKNALKNRGVVTEFDVSREMGEIESREKMEREAIIIDPNKNRDEKKE